MKKILILLFLLLVLSFGMAQDINLGDFPEGKWLDAKYSAVWTFSTDNIKLYMTDGSLVFDFKDKIEDFKVSPSLSGVDLTFSCKETGRDYKFTKGVTNLDLTLVIDRDNGVHYETEMKMDK